MSTQGEIGYEKLTHELDKAGQAVAMVTGILPITFPMGGGGNVHGGGTGPNYVRVGLLIWTLERFAEEVGELVKGIELYHHEHPGSAKHDAKKEPGL